MKLVISPPTNEIVLPVSTFNSELDGGDITLEGGVLTAESGRIDLTAIGNNQGEPTRVNLNNTSGEWSVNSAELRQLGDISLSQESLVNASAAGSIQLQGRNISFRNGSLALIQNTTSAAAGDITIRAAEVLQLDGMSTNGEIRSGLENQTLGTGRGGDIQVKTANVSIMDGAGIFTRNFNMGASGNITIDATGDIQVTDFFPGSSANSAIANLGFGSGKVGKIEIKASYLTILNAATLSSTNFGTGEGGDVIVDIADSIKIAGINPLTQNAANIGAGSFSTGNAGTVKVDTGFLFLSNRGRVNSGGFAQGNAGSVVVNATKLIDISDPRSSIDSSIDIFPSAVREAFGLPDIPTGDAGSVTINIPVLRLTDKGSVSVKNDGVGNAGNLEINADSIILNQEGAITAFTTTGTGGNIFLNLQNSLIMRRGSLIDSESFSNGNGGNITINSPVIVGLENSDIIANAVEGNGGNISITTQGIFGLQFRDSLTPESDITASSEFGVSGTVDIKNFGIDPSSGLAELSVKLADASEKVATGCADTRGSSFIATGRGGIPQNPNQQVNTNRTWSDIRDLSAYRQNQSVVAKVPKASETFVEATSWKRNADGKIELVADNSSTQVQPSLTCTVLRASNK